MYSITHVYVKSGHGVRAYFPTDLTLRELLDKIHNGADVAFAISVHDSEMHTDYGLDAMTILQEKCIHGTDTWQDLINQITAEWIVGYDNFSFGFMPGSDRPQFTARHCYPLTTVGMTCHYTDIKSPNEYDIFQFRWGMPDLMVEKHDSALDIDLKNCIPVINGMASFSHMYNDRLYVHDGSRHMWDTTEQHRPDVLLIDTTPLGDSKMYRLNECEKRYRNIAEEDWTHSEWEIILPENISLRTHSVILVLGGVMYLPGEYLITSHKSIRIHPETLMLDKQLLHKYKASARLDDTVYSTEQSVQDYLHQVFTSEKIHDAFIVAIDNPNVYVHTTEVCPYANHHLGIVDSIGGMLRHRSTMFIHSYMKSEYNSLELVYHNEHDDEYVFDTPYLGITPGVDRMRLKQHPFKNTRETVCDLIHLTAPRKTPI